LRRLYSGFVQQGDLVFDVGAHLGDRTAAFATLGARVVALEPQPHIARWLRRLVGRRESVIVRTEAVGAEEGRVVDGHPGFSEVRWEHSIEVPVITLDRLIEAYGRPAFCKIDVEGYEAEVLAGLSQPVPALSFEFVAGQLDVAAACVDRLEELAGYRFNVVLAEGRRFVFDAWVGPDDVHRWLRGGAGSASSGDVYARLEDRDAT
jgi:FkbM family methyltransferase